MSKWREDLRQQGMTDKWWLDEIDGWSPDADNEWSKDGQKCYQPLAVGVALKTPRAVEHDAEYVLLDKEGNNLTSLNGMIKRHIGEFYQDSWPTLKLAQAEIEKEFRFLLKIMETERTNISLQAIAAEMYHRPATDLYAKIIKNAAIEALSDGLLPDEATLDELAMQIGEHVMNQVYPARL